MILDDARGGLTLGDAMIVECKSCGKANRLPAARIGDRARCASCKAPLLPLAHPVAVHSAEEFDELVRDARAPLLVDFWAAWCGPCRTVAPELEKLAQQRSGSLIVAKVDTEELAGVASRFDIRSIPTMILFRAGHEARRVSGAMPAEAIASQLTL